MYALLLIAAAPFVWEPSRDDPRVLRCWDGPHAGTYHLVGEYDTSTGTYGEMNPATGRYDRWAEPPATRNFGVVLERLGRTPTYRLSGRVVSEAEALAAIGDAKIPDRSRQGWLTVHGGTEQQRGQLLARIPADVQSLYRCNSYPAGHWALRPGFRASETQASLTVQRPDGGVIHRQDDGDVTDGLISALREADPKYDAAKDPDRRRPGTPGGRLPWSVPAAALILGGVYLTARRRAS
jgi:hypothetical protein